MEGSCRFVITGILRPRMADFSGLLRTLRLQAGQGSLPVCRRADHRAEEASRLLSRDNGSVLLVSLFPCFDMIMFVDSFLLGMLPVFYNAILLEHRLAGNTLPPANY